MTKTKPNETTIEQLHVDFKKDLDALRWQGDKTVVDVWADLVKAQRRFADRLCAEVGTVEARRIAKSVRIRATRDEKTAVHLAELGEKDEAEKAQAVSA